MKENLTFQELQKKLENFELSTYQLTICKNIKRKRKELYEKNKEFYKSIGKLILGNIFLNY